MSLDPKLVAEALFYAERVAQHPQSGHEARFLAREALPALLAEIERLALECRAKDQLVEVARQEIQRLRGGGDAGDTKAGDPGPRPFVPPVGPCPNCTLEWWEHDEQEQLSCRELLTSSPP